MKKLNLSDIMSQELSVGGKLKPGCYTGTVTKIEKTTKNNKSYIDLKVNVNNVLINWRVFDTNRFKLEYEIATGSSLRRISEIKDKTIKFYAEINGKFNKFSMLQPMPELGAYEVEFGGLTPYDEYDCFVIELIFDENVTYYDIKHIEDDNDLEQFKNYTASGIAYQFGYELKVALKEFENHIGQPLVINIIKLEQYKTPFINYDVIKVTELTPDNPELEDEIENQIEDDIEEI